MKLICRAIHEKRTLSFVYGGLARVVEPYCHGTTRTGKEVLRAVQVAGQSQSGGLGFGKLWEVAKMSDLTIATSHFAPDDPNYNPNDSAMASIHCRI